MPAEKSISGGTEGVQIRGGGSGFPPDNFGGEELGRAHQLALSILDSIQLHCFDGGGEAQVRQARAPIGAAHEVCGLDVPVHEALGLGIGKSPGRIGDNGEHLAPRQGAV